MFRRLHVVVVAIGVAALFVAALVFISFPINTAWLLVSMMPVAMLAGVLLHIVSPNESDSQGVLRPEVHRRQWHPGTFLNSQAVTPTSDAETTDGVWRGTVFLRRINQPVRHVPLRVVMGGFPIRTRLLPSEQCGAGDRIVGFDVLEGDVDGRSIRFRLDVVGGDRMGRLSHELCVSGEGGRLVSVDETEDVTIELGRESSQFSGVV